MRKAWRVSFWTAAAHSRRLNGLSSVAVCPGLTQSHSWRSHCCWWFHHQSISAFQLPVRSRFPSCRQEVAGGTSSSPRICITIQDGVIIVWTVILLFTASQQLFSSLWSIKTHFILKKISYDRFPRLLQSTIINNAVWFIYVLTVQKEACVWAPEFVDGDTSVVTVITVGHIKKGQFGQWASV